MLLIRVVSVKALSYLGLMLLACSSKSGAGVVSAPPRATSSAASSSSPAKENVVTAPSASTSAATPVVTSPPVAFAVARRSTANIRPLRASGVVLGERWGCARLATRAGATMQCWDAPRSAGQKVQAFTVPWLANRELQAGPDRICEFARPELTFRCWKRPQRGQSEGLELPASHEWLNPNHADWNDVYTRSDRVANTFLGGAFACLQATRDNEVWCVGDDRFGQLGGSSPVPPPQADSKDPAFVQHLWPAERVALGTWHACAMAAPNGLARGGHIACWGRGDHGQLGAPAPDQCEVDGEKVPCAKTPLAGVRFSNAMLTIFAGDLFTCMSSPDDISCWGASRDGFFGSPGKCPASLRRAWPTLNGHVPAPRAACSDKPVKITNVRGFQQFPSVGPRGICFDADAPLRCVGGIRTPRAKGIRDVVVSQGEDAAACGIRDGEVVCWGDGYSPAGKPDVAVPIGLEATPAVSEVAVLGPEDPARYSASCLARTGCDFGPAPVPPCAKDVVAREWSDLWSKAEPLLGEVISVRGAIAVGPVRGTMMGCRATDGIGCCNSAGGPVVLGAAPALRLQGLFCAGDDSQLCCNGPAYGEPLVARGRLEVLRDNAHGALSKYQLTSVTLCKQD